MRHACGINGAYNRSCNPSIHKVPISGSGWFSPSSSWKPCIGIIRTIFLFITDIAQPSISILWHPSGDGLKPMRPNKATCFFWGFRERNNINVPVVKIVVPGDQGFSLVLSHLQATWHGVVCIGSSIPKNGAKPLLFGL